jgi:hypothetical protein
VTLAQRDEAQGEVWHIPSAETITTRRFIEMVFEQVQRPARLQTVPRLMISMLEVFIPAMRAVKETLYQSERPWAVDHGKFARAFGGRPTPHEQAIAETLAWFKPTVTASQP